MANKVWRVIETDVTPALLKSWAARLDTMMQEATIGDEVPAIEIKCHETESIILLRANQERYHSRKNGGWWL